MSSEGILMGTVRYFNNSRGYGFIICDDQGPDAFIHHSEINSTEEFKILSEGCRVQFSIISTDKGPRAKNVTVI